jgi:ATP-dependent DNA helicase RecG
MHFISPEFRNDIFQNIKEHTNENGINVMNIQVGADGVWRNQDDDNQKDDVLEHSKVKADISLDLLVRLREYLREPRSRAELQSFCKISSRDYFRNKILNPLIDSQKIKLTIPDKPNSLRASHFGLTVQCNSCFHRLSYNQQDGRISYGNKFLYYE